MKVCDVMTETPVTVHSDASLRDAAALMLQYRVSGLPVVDAGGALVGVITEGDLIRRAELGTAGDPHGWLSTFLNPGRVALDYVHTHGLKVGEVMARELITASPDTPLALVVDVMESKQIKRLPVLQNSKLVGIVSRADLLRALVRLLPDRKVLATSDAELRKRVLSEIDKQRWAPRTTIDVTVENGIVELRGAVTDDRERIGLRVIAENTLGVRGVHDRLIWVEPNSGTVIDPT
jgi:CBS domain-containing protein